MGYIDGDSTSGSIPVTLGSVSGSSSRTNSQSGSIDHDMPLRKSTSTPIDTSSEPSYMNVRPDISTRYCEKAEGHYARLADLKIQQTDSETPSAPSNDTQSDTLGFYRRKAAEHRSRSRSRNADDQNSRGRSRSARSSSRPTQTRSASRGRSASRDIMALYTNRQTNDIRLRDKSSSPERNSVNQLVQHNQRLKAMYGQMSMKEKSRAWIKNQAQHLPSKPAVTTKPDSSSSQQLTALETDVEKNYQIERELLAANSLRPAEIRMVMMATHTPKAGWESKDEVAVKTGELVTARYKQNEWVYVQTRDNCRGFVPYAYAKPVRTTTAKSAADNSVTRQRRKSPLPSSAKPVTGILKTAQSTKQKQSKSSQKHSVKVRTSADNESLSSECSSAYLDDFVFTRAPGAYGNIRADCMVFNSDDISPKLELPLQTEDTGTYCSDSGISDPSSTHSEDSELLHSPTSVIDQFSLERLGIPLSTTRLHKERIVSVTTRMLEPSQSKTGSRTTRREPSTNGRHNHAVKSPISEMPLGPLGARLSKLELDQKNNGTSEPQQQKRKLTSDMKDRARSSSNTASNLRPEIPKDYNGPRVTVVFDYHAENDDDLAVKSSDVVTVLNGEDIEWIWVQRRDGKEGFIPREYVIPLDLSHQHNRRRIGVSLI